MRRLEIDRRGMLWLLVLVLCVMLLALYFAIRNREMEDGGGAEGAGQEILEGERPDVDRSKIEGYQKGDRLDGHVSADVLWASLEKDMADEVVSPSPADSGSALTAGNPGQGRPDAETLRRRMLESADAAYGEPAQSQSRTSSSGGSRGGSSARRPSTQKERDDKLRHDYELASELAMKMYGVDPEDAKAQGSAGEADAVPQRISVPAQRTGGPSSGAVVSSLDGPWDGGLEGLDSGQAGQGAEADEDRPFRCMFLRDEKIRSGQRVTLRLLEDMVVDGILIPANSHITATCSLKDRLMVSVSSIEMNGRIHSLDMDGYDTDGALGIYCPGVNGSAAKTARDDALTIGQSAIRGSIGSIASSVLRTGASIVRSASNGETSVSVPAGYEFYIMKSARKR